MSTKLSPEQREQIRCDYERWGDSRAAKHIPGLLDHCTALEEQLKAAQEENNRVQDWRNNLHDYLMSEDAVVKKAVNDFRAQLISHLQALDADVDGDLLIKAKQVIQLISTFELESK